MSARFVIDRSSIVHLDTMLDPVLLYHATPSKFVDDIKKGVKLDRAKPRTDFHRERHAFYLTDNEDIAKTVMAEEVGGFASQPTAVITFSLDLDDLKVKTFSSELEGDTLDEWRAVWMNPRTNPTCGKFTDQTWLTQHVNYCRFYQKKSEPLPAVPATVTANFHVIIGWMSTKKQGRYEPGDSHVWQYAILTEEALSKLKFVKVEYQS